MSYEDSAGLNVNNHYGERKVGGAIGHIKSEGAYKELTIEITGEMLNNSFRPEAILPAGSLPVEAYIDVSEAFDLGGTAPTILVGTSGSEVTNGLVVSEAIAEAVATEDLSATLTGTWAASLAAATTVGVTMGGTSPTAAAAAGKGRLVVRYISI